MVNNHSREKWNQANQALPPCPQEPPNAHLQQFVLLTSPLLPLVDDASPQDPGVLLQVWQVGGSGGAGHQRGAAVASWAAHWSHGLGISFQQPASRERWWGRGAQSTSSKEAVWLRSLKSIFMSSVRHKQPLEILSVTLGLFLSSLSSLLFSVWGNTGESPWYHEREHLWLPGMTRYGSQAFPLD